MSTSSIKSGLSLLLVVALALGSLYATNPQAREWARETWLRIQASLDLNLNLRPADGPASSDSSSAQDADGSAGADLRLQLGGADPTPAP